MCTLRPGSPAQALMPRSPKCKLILSLSLSLSGLGVTVRGLGCRGLGCRGLGVGASLSLSRSLPTCHVHICMSTELHLDAPALSPAVGQDTASSDTDDVRVDVWRLPNAHSLELSSASCAAQDLITEQDLHKAVSPLEACSAASDKSRGICRRMKDSKRSLSSLPCFIEFEFAANKASMKSSKPEPVPLRSSTRLRRL